MSINVAAYDFDIGKESFDEIPIGFRSPLVDHISSVNGRALHDSDTLTVLERRALDLVILRGTSEESSFQEAVLKAVGTEVPTRPTRVNFGESHAIAWLGPDEWLVVSSEPNLASTGESRTQSTLTHALGQLFANAVDVGSGYTTVRLSGPSAIDILAAGCPLDLHESVFVRGNCAQSHYFQAPIFIMKLAADVFDLVIRRSFSDYIASMICDTAEAL